MGCGKDTKIFYNEMTGKYRQGIYRCKSISCPQCRQVIQANFTNSLKGVSSIYKMWFFTTFSTSGVDDELQSWFTKVNKSVKDMYKRGITEEIVEEEALYQLMIKGTSRSRRGKTYINRTDIMILLNSFENGEDYKSYLKGLKDEGFLDNNHYYKLVKKIPKPQKVKEMSNDEEYLMFKEYYYFFIAELKKRAKADPKQYERFLNIVKLRFQHNEDVEDLKYVRVLEYTKEGRKHYHVLFNKYVPDFKIHSSSSQVCYVADNKYIKEDKETFLINPEFDPEGVADYMTKYVTKDTLNILIGKRSENEEVEERLKGEAHAEAIKRLKAQKVKAIRGTESYDSIYSEVLKELKEEENFKKVCRIVQASQGLDVNLSYNTEAEIEQGWKCIETITNKIPPLSQIDTEIIDLKEFKASLKDYVKGLNFSQTRTMDYKDEYLGFCENLDRAIKIYTEKGLAIAKGDNDKIKAVKKKAKEIYRELKGEIIDIHKGSLDFHSAGMLLEEIVRRKGVKANVFSYKKKPQFKIPDKSQEDFIKSVITSPKPFVIISGKAGTGKTATVAELLNCIDLKDSKAVIVAPTGKATSRVADMKTTEDIKAMTVHRACKANYGLVREIAEFSYNEYNVLPYDLVLIDESGMLDRLTLSLFLNALKPECKVVFIGDKNQLPPIFLSSIFDESATFSDMVEYVELTTIHRSGDKVKDQAYEVLAGKFNRYEDFNLEKIKEKYKEGYQILTNKNKTRKKISKELLKDRTALIIDDYRRYNIGDKVICGKNNSFKGVFNGEVFVLDKIEGNTITVVKGDEGYNFSLSEFISLFEPAIVLTVHRSQGSEYDKVLAVFSDCEPLMTMNILYTAITRAKSEVIVMLEEEAKKNKSLFTKPSQVNVIYNISNVDISSPPRFDILDSQINKLCQ